MPCDDCSRTKKCPPCPYEKPEEPACGHPNKQPAGSTYDGPGGCKTWQYYYCPDCKTQWREEEKPCFHAANDSCDACDPEEPPMAPEEEEQAPLDEPGPEHVCETYYCPTVGEVESACHGGFDVCCSAPEKHVPADQAPKPPQPERRPPLLVSYSVAGHLYEVALSGDAVVSAVDGALIIQHGLGPVAGIVHVAPLINEEGN